MTQGGPVCRTPHIYERKLSTSKPRYKGEAAIDWSDRQARAALLAGIVADADRLLELSRQAQGELPEDSTERQRIVAAAELQGQSLLQDVERIDDGVSLKDGVSRDRMMSVHDPEMRHGHKSSRRRFDGHKAAIVVDTDTQLSNCSDFMCPSYFEPVIPGPVSSTGQALTRNPLHPARSLSLAFLDSCPRSSRGQALRGNCGWPCRGHV